MDKIEFRAICSDISVFSDPLYSYNYEDLYEFFSELARTMRIYSCFIELQEFTGLFDKNRKKIFVGDIIKTNYIDRIIIDSLFCNFVTHTHIDIDRMNDPEKHIEIIGNIYEDL